MVPSAPVNVTFSGNVPGNVTQVRFRGTTAANQTVQTGLPIFPITTPFLSQVGPVNVPTNVTTLIADFLTATNTIVTTSNTTATLSANTAVTLNIPFDFNSVLNGTIVQGALFVIQSGGNIPAIYSGPINFQGNGTIGPSNVSVLSTAGAANFTVTGGNYTVDLNRNVAIHFDSTRGPFDSTGGKVAVNGGQGVLVQGTGNIGSTLETVGNPLNNGTYVGVRPASGTTNASLTGRYVVGGDVVGAFFPQNGVLYGDIIFGGNGVVTGGSIFTAIGPAIVGNNTITNAGYNTITNGAYQVNTDGSFTMSYTTVLLGTQNASGVIGADGTILFVSLGSGFLVASEGYGATAAGAAADLSGTYTVAGMATNSATGTSFGDIRGTLTFDGAGSITGGSIRVNEGAAADVTGGTYSVAADGRTAVTANLQGGGTFTFLTDGSNVLAAENGAKTFIGGIGGTSTSGIQGLVNLIK